MIQHLVRGVDLGAFVRNISHEPNSVNDIFENVPIFELFFPVLQNVFLGCQSFNLVPVIEEDGNEMGLEEIPVAVPDWAIIEVCVFALIYNQLLFDWSFQDAVDEVTPAGSLIRRVTKAQLS